MSDGSPFIKSTELPSRERLGTFNPSGDLTMLLNVCYVANEAWQKPISHFYASVISFKICADSSELWIFNGKTEEGVKKKLIDVTTN